MDVTGLDFDRKIRPDALVRLVDLVAVGIVDRWGPFSLCRCVMDCAWFFAACVHCPSWFWLRIIDVRRSPHVLWRVYGGCSV